MVNEYSNHMSVFAYGEPLPKATIRASRASAPQRRELNTRPIRAFARVKRVSAGKYTIKAYGNPENIHMIMKRLKAFNDMEISYDDNLDASSLIVKSKKELWTIHKADNGEFILERNV